jgi:uncharacterized phiE125 gp8 family phage protein
VGLVRLVPPAAPLASLDEARLHLRADAVEDSPLIEGLVEAATLQAEAFTRRRFVTQSWRLTLDRFPGGAIVLPYPPLVSVESLTYVDGGGSLATLAPESYRVRTAESPGEVVPAYGTAWPATRPDADAVQVEFTCGYGAPADVPEAIRRAVLLLVGTLYANRETVAPTAMQPVPHSAEWLLGPYRVVRFAA